MNSALHGKLKVLRQALKGQVMEIFIHWVNTFFVEVTAAGVAGTVVHTVHIIRAKHKEKCLLCKRPWQEVTDVTEEQA